MSSTTSRDHVWAESAQAWIYGLGRRSIGTTVMQKSNSLLCWVVFPPWRPFLVRRRPKSLAMIDLTADSFWSACTFVALRRSCLCSEEKVCLSVQSILGWFAVEQPYLQVSAQVVYDFLLQYTHSFVFFYHACACGFIFDWRGPVTQADQPNSLAEVPM